MGLSLGVFSMIIQMSKKGGKKVTIGEEQRSREELIQMKKLDTTGLKEEVYQLREQLSYLLKQKSLVESETIKGSEKFMKESFEIEKTTKIQEEELTDLENNYKLLRHTFEETRKKHRNDWESELEVLLRKKATEKEGLMKTIAQMAAKIEHLRQFRTRQGDYLSVLERLREREESNKAHQMRDIEKIVGEHEEKRKEVREVVAKEIESIKELEVNKLEQKMNKQQQLKRENELIQEEIALCLSEKDVLEKECRELADHSSNPKNNIDSQLSDQANETYQRSLRVLKLQQKYTRLKQQLSSDLLRLDGELKNVQRQGEEQKLELQGRIGKLQSWLRLKEKDIKKMKACSQMVLNQRSNLQAYLLEVFYERPELDYKDSNNINQILRALFVKINSKKPPTNYRDFLGNTLNSQVSSNKTISQL